VRGTRVQDSIPQHDIDLGLLIGPGTVTQGYKSVKTYITAFNRQVTKAHLGVQQPGGFERVILQMFRAGLNEEYQKEAQFSGENYITSIEDLHKHLLKVEAIKNTSARATSLRNKGTRPKFNPAAHRGFKKHFTSPPPPPQAHALQTRTQNTRPPAPAKPDKAAAIALVQQAPGGSGKQARASGPGKIQYHGSREELQAPLRNNPNLALFQANWLSDHGYCFYCLEKMSDCQAHQQKQKCLARATLQAQHFKAGCPRTN
jgi:hypothetical protein